MRLIGVKPSRFGITLWSVMALIIILGERYLSLDIVCALQVAVATIASFSLPLPVTLMLSSAAVLVINWLLVPPQGSFLIDLQQHAVLLSATWLASSIIPALIALQRAYTSWLSAQRADDKQLNLRIQALASVQQSVTVDWLYEQIAAIVNDAVSLLVIQDPLVDLLITPRHRYRHEPSFEDRAIMWIVLRQGHSFGPLTGANEHLPAWFIRITVQQRPVGVMMIPASHADKDILAAKRYACIRQYIMLFDRLGTLPVAEPAPIDTNHSDG